MRHYSIGSITAETVLKHFTEYLYKYTDKEKEQILNKILEVVESDKRVVIKPISSSEERFITSYQLMDEIIKE